MRYAFSTLAILSIGFAFARAGSEARAQEITSEQISARVIATTVTVRATYPVPGQPAVGPLGAGQAVPPQAGPNLPADPNVPAKVDPNVPHVGANPPIPPVNAAKPAPRSAVAVASGVSLGHGLIVTFVSAPGTARIRVSLPDDGGSADARPVVVDHYSGLTLLQIDQVNLASLPLVDKTPAVGATVYTAAGSGTEEPMVSRGILSGTLRPMGALLPPVLPCDIRTTASSSGAPLVDQTGRLVGIVAGTDATGWAYAVPVQHVERLMKARPSEGVVVLERRQPILGLNLRPGARDNVEQPPTVEVARVIAGGPSEKSGFMVGDFVSEVDGKKVRILYDVSKIILSKQPGDRVAFTVRRGEAEIPMTITLGGAADTPQALAKLDERQTIGVAQPFAGSQRTVQVPSVIISSSTASGTSITLAPNERPSGDRLLVGPPGSKNEAAPAQPAEVDRLQLQVAQMQSALDRRDREVALLKLQLEGWAKALQAFQAKLQVRDAAQDATDKMIKELEQELERLRKQK